MTWIVYNIVFLIANTVLGIIIAAEYLEISSKYAPNDNSRALLNIEAVLIVSGAGYILVVTLYLCK
jgi:hypothetical protein